MIKFFFHKKKIKYLIYNVLNKIFSSKIRIKLENNKKKTQVINNVWCHKHFFGSIKKKSISNGHVCFF